MTEVRKALTAGEIISAVEIKAVDLESLGGVVYVRPLPWRLQSRFYGAVGDEGNGAPAGDRTVGRKILEEFAPEIVGCCMVDETGAKIAADDETLDALLAAMSVSDVLTVVNAVFDFSGTTEAGQEAIAGN